MIYVDYNDLGSRNDNQLAALYEDSPPPAVGEVVLTGDHEGNRCEGRVQRVEGRIAYIDVDLDTWREEGE